MCYDLRLTVGRVADKLTARAADLRRPRPLDWTPEESDRRVAAALEELAEELRQAMSASSQDR